MYVKEIKVYFHIPDSETTTYTLVNDASDLRTGDNVVFLGSKDASSYYAATALTSDHLGIETVTLSSNSVEVTNALEFTIFRDGNYVSFSYNSTYLAGTSGSTSAVQFASTITNDAKFSVSFSNTNVATIKGNGTATYKYFRFYSSGGSRYFTFANSSTAYYPAYIFKKTSQTNADTWCESFLSGTASCDKTNWSTLASSYSDLSNGAKAEIVNCQANASTDYNLRAQAMARYEYMLSDPRFNAGLTAFVTGRSVSLARPNLVPLVFNKENNSIAIIIIISLVSVSTVGGYFFLKSRKKENI